MKNFTFITLLTLTLAITSCAPDRRHKDEKLARACEETVRALSDRDDQIEVRETTFESATGNDDVPLRVVNLTVKFTAAQGSIDEKTYICSYLEQGNRFSYLPEFYSLEKDGNKYGNFDGHVLGDVNDLIKINAATEKAFY